MSLPSDAEEEKDPMISSDQPTEACNKGDAHQVLPASTLSSGACTKTSREFFAFEYATRLEERKKNGKERLESGIREELVKRAIDFFQIEDKFDVPRRTIFSHILLWSGSRSGIPAQSLPC